MKAVLINGSPRKKWNTAQALQKVGEGLASCGEDVQTELIHLAHYTFKGCMSCFACKRKNSTTNGLCAYKDDLSPVLEQVHSADIVVVGSPVYYSLPTGQVRSFIERWLFPVGSYVWIDGKQKVYRDRVVPTAMIYTMNCPKDMMERYNYPALLSETGKNMQAIMGHNELLYLCNTYQFSDYDKYEMNLFTEAEKRAYRDEHFAEDLARCFDLGVRLFETLRSLRG